MVSRFDPEPKSLVTVGASSLLLLLGSFFVEVQVIVVRPGIGDVTDVLRTAWQLSVGAATVGSFLLALHRLRSSKRGNSTGGLDIRGHNHDIDVHLHLGDVAKRVQLADRIRTDVESGDVEPSDERSGDDGDSVVRGTDDESGDENGSYSAN